MRESSSITKILLLINNDASKKSGPQMTLLSSAMKNGNCSPKDLVLEKRKHQEDRPAEGCKIAK